MNNSLWYIIHISGFYFIELHAVLYTLIFLTLTSVSSQEKTISYYISKFLIDIIIQAFWDQIWF